MEKVEKFLRVTVGREKVDVRRRLRIPDSVVIEVWLKPRRLHARRLLGLLNSIVREYYSTPYIRYFTGQKPSEVVKIPGFYERYLYVSYSMIVLDEETWSRLIERLINTLNQLKSEELIVSYNLYVGTELSTFYEKRKR